MPYLPRGGGTEEAKVTSTPNDLSSRCIPAQSQPQHSSDCLAIPTPPLSAQVEKDCTSWGTEQRRNCRPCLELRAGPTMMNLNTERDPTDSGRVWWTQWGCTTLPKSLWKNPWICHRFGVGALSDADRVKTLTQQTWIQCGTEC